MQRDTGADPRLIFVEIDTHHFALAHTDKIIHEYGPSSVGTNAA